MDAVIACRTDQLTDEHRLNELRRQYEEYVQWAAASVTKRDRDQWTRRALRTLGKINDIEQLRHLTWW